MYTTASTTAETVKFCGITWKQKLQEYIAAFERDCSNGWFGVAATAFVTSTKLSYVEPVSTRIGDRPLAGLHSRYLSRPPRPTQPCHPSLGGCYEYRRWFQPPLGRNGVSEVMSLCVPGSPLDRSTHQSTTKPQSL